MSNDLVLLERQFEPLLPQFADALGGMMTPERLIRTVIISIERLPALLDCNRQSIFAAAMSAAVLGLEVDGVTGQAYLIPFKGRAQLVIGYKGYNTLGARAGLTITGEVVREGDEFDYELGSNAFVRHKPTLAPAGDRRIIAAWAQAAASGRPPVIAVMGVDEINAVKARSPGAKRSESPWNDPTVGYPAMASKTAKRRLARALPLSVFQLAARLDEVVEEEGRPASIAPDRKLMIEGVADREPSRTPTMQDLTSSATAEPAGGASAIAPLEADGFPGEVSVDALVVTAREKATEGAGIFNAWYRRLPEEQVARLEPHQSELRQRMNAARDAALSELTP